MAEQASIADSSRPNAGRIYDFLLGGNHNFEVDRQTAQQILRILPFFPQVCRLIRWYLGEAVRRLVDEGYRHFLDFASGLPTVDHIHQVAPAGTKVIYSDVDPVTVAYGRELVKDNANVRYVVCDAGRAEEVLSSPVVAEMFGATKKVAIGFNGVSWFLPDDKVSHSLKVLYEWAAPGSKLFLSYFDSSTFPQRMNSMAEIYEKMGQPAYARSGDTMRELIGAWRVLPPGLLALEEWVDMEKTVAAQTREGMGGLLMGVILGKE